jgi:thiamine biosynthesis lipoprotein
MLKRPGLLLLLLPLPLLAAGSAWAQPVRMSIDAFGGSARVEIHGLPQEQAEAVAREALLEIHQVDELMDAESSLPGSLGELNAAAGTESVTLDPRVADALVRATQYCGWSNGAFGPAAGSLFRLWENLGEAPVPEPRALRQAVLESDCDRLRLQGSLAPGESVQAVVAEGTRIDLRGAERGFAIDRAFEILAEHGVENAWIEIAPIQRAIGPGPDGKGWYAALPSLPGSRRPVEELYLKDQALAVIGLETDGESAATILDQRTGVPTQGVILVAMVATIALDAEILAHVLYITGQREGQRRLGSLEPRPSVLWLFGDSPKTRNPLQSTYRWSEIHRVPRKR